MEEKTNLSVYVVEHPLNQCQSLLGFHSGKRSIVDIVQWIYNTQEIDKKIVILILLTVLLNLLDGMSIKRMTMRMSGLKRIEGLVLIWNPISWVVRMRTQSMTKKNKPTVNINYLFFFGRCQCMDIDLDCIICIDRTHRLYKRIDDFDCTSIT
jgi:hypothetical protein